MLFQKNQSICKINTQQKKKLKIEYKDFKELNIKQVIELNQEAYISMKECQKVVKRKMMKEVVINRPQFWTFFTKIDQYRQLYGDFYYQNLKFIKFPLVFQKQIDKDIKRTANHDDNIHDQTLVDRLLKGMNEVLANYSRRNAYVGYCQGLNFIVYFLLQDGYQNEQCFWILTNIIENILPISYFTSMEDVMVDMMILQKLVLFYIPDLHVFMNRIQADLAIPVIRWFLCLFTSSDFRREIVQVIWDFLIFEGNIALFKASLLVLQMIKKDIKRARDFAQAIRIIETQVNQLNDPIDFHYRMTNFYISRKMMKFCRIKFSEEYKIKRQREIEM